MKRYPKACFLCVHVLPREHFQPPAGHPGSGAGCTQWPCLVPHEPGQTLVNSFYFLKQKQKKNLPDPFLNSCFPTYNHLFREAHW